jgi:Ricin-type beta-trefoil lectin domain
MKRPRFTTIFAALALVFGGALAASAGAQGASAAPSAPAGHAQTRIVGVYYQIVARHSHKCVDVEGASTRDGAPVIQYHCIVRHVNQEFDFDLNRDGYYQIRARHSGKCLDVDSASTADGARIIQYRCHGGTNQQFSVLGVL